MKVTASVAGNKKWSGENLCHTGHGDDFSFNKDITEKNMTLQLLIAHHLYRVCQRLTIVSFS
jgi:hypothetical protein